MTLKERATKFSDKFQTKSGKFLAFWGTLVALWGVLPVLIGVFLWVGLWFKDIYYISTYVKEFKEVIKYLKFNEMQGISIDHEEMETVTMYGVQLQKTNTGDLWYFSTTEINGQRLPIMYSANIKKKAKKVEKPDGSVVYSHIYIQDINGNHVWIEDIK